MDGESGYTLEQLRAIREQLIQRLDAGGDAYDGVEIEDGQLVIIRGDERIKVVLPSREDQIRRSLERMQEEEEIRRELTLRAVDSMRPYRVDNRRTEPWMKGKNTERHFGLNGRLKRDKAKAQRKKMKQHKRRGR